MYGTGTAFEMSSEEERKQEGEFIGKEKKNSMWKNRVCVNHPKM